MEGASGRLTWEVCGGKSIGAAGGRTMKMPLLRGTFEAALPNAVYLRQERGRLARFFIRLRAGRPRSFLQQSKQYWAGVPVWEAGKFACVVAAGLVVAGCARVETYDRKSAPEYVTVKATDFFVNGPMQPGRPIELPAQEFVKVLSRDPGFSVVLLEDGKSGWVDSRSIRPAPPAGRAVPEEEIFPERAITVPPMPEPDLKLPVEDVPQQGKTSQKKS